MLRYVIFCGMWHYVLCITVILGMLFWGTASSFLFSPPPTLSSTFVQAAKKTAANKNDYSVRAQKYKAAAKKGKAKAQFVLAEFYELGNLYKENKGIALDHGKALYWYKKAAKQGYAKAQFSLAQMYEEGVYEDGKKAVYWYKKAAKRGNAEAQFRLAQMYEEGERVTQSKAKAVYWYKKAAAQNHEFADEVLERLQ